MNARSDGTARFSGATLVIRASRPVPVAGHGSREGGDLTYGQTDGLLIEARFRHCIGLIKCLGRMMSSELRCAAVDRQVYGLTPNDTGGRIVTPLPSHPEELATPNR